tara:strand:+ start:32 stop:607 length:576 start_codon:yes stop_codon:yes gene_type:complete
MKNKPAKKFFESTNYSIKQCDEKGCNEEGNFIAPKSPNSGEKYFFCLKHIKIYNKRWNFFAGKSQAEIYNFQKNDFFEGKPTFPFSDGMKSKIKFEFNYFVDKEKLKFSEKRKKFEKVNKLIFNAEVESSLRLMKLNKDFNEDDLKKVYKQLVKKFHPDVKNNIKNKEKIIKKINNAYKLLFNFLKNNKCK